MTYFSGRWMLVMGSLSLALVLSALVAVFTSTSAEEPATPEFTRTWERTDKPVIDGIVARTWMWAPEAFTELNTEPYAESPNGDRLIQYFDKSRMEITNPNQPDDGLWYVTNGLLVVEMIDGQIQVGDDEFIEHGDAEVNVAGDPGDENSPTYATFSGLTDPVDEYVGMGAITERLARDGTVSDDPSLAQYGITYGAYDDVTGHNIATPFWDFMGSSGTVYDDGEFVEDRLFENRYYATGRPVSEPYFADVSVAGTTLPVLMQCFERRCMTYTPSNQEGFQVEAGNVGLHYFCWRYGYLPEGKGQCIGSPAEPGDPGEGDGDPTATPDDGDNGDGGTATATDDNGGGGGGGDDPTATSTEDDDGDGNGDDPTATEDGGNGGDPTATATEGGGGGGDPTATATNTPTATATATQTATATATEQVENDITIVSVPNDQEISLSLVGSGNYSIGPITVRNDGEEAVSGTLSISQSGGLSTCTLNSTSQGFTLNPGQTQDISFGGSCLLNVAADLDITYNVTATVPGDSDSDSFSVTISLSL